MCCSLVACTNKEAQMEDAKNMKVATLNVQLGMAYLGKGDMQRAKQKLLYAIQKYPNLPEAWYSMAYFNEKTGNKEDAKIDYLKSVELAPNRGDVQNNYGTFLCRSGEYEDSIQHFLLAAKDPQYLDTASAYENAGLCALKVPNKKAAAEYFNLALGQDPTRITSMNELTRLKG